MTAVERHRGKRAYRLVRLAIAALQARLATAFGVSRGRRIETVVLMLENNARRAPGYWLQLFLATGIATLGLVLGSTAVVIGGMLVSPLMGPIVELGMGFAIGSSLLVIRAFLRVLLSVVVVVVAAAVITLTLPFHELTSEIASRTSPTILDLLVAAFCALAAAYTTVRQTADTTAAAAGTAIGIALVPPLCVSGFGLGTGSGVIAGGAGLLFTANFSAILGLAVFAFLLLGYNEVSAADLEQDYIRVGHDRTERLADRVHRTLRSAFGSRYGLAMRLFVPLALLAVVALPLRQALDEVAWEVRVRDAVRRLLAAEETRAMQSALVIERNNVTLRLVIVGSLEEGERLRRNLRVRIAAASGVEPNVTVTAVPDAGVLATTLVSEARETERSPAVELADVEARIASAVSAAWPESAAGPLQSWSVELASGRPVRLTVTHLGPPLGAAAEQMLGRTVSVALGRPVQVVDAALPASTLTANTPADSTWLAAALQALSYVARTDSTLACITRPAAQRGLAARAAGTRDAIELALRATAAAHAGRLVVADGDAWSIRVSRTDCQPPSATAPGAASPQ